MLFPSIPSIACLVFAALFFLLWPLARSRRNVRHDYLVFASFAFHGWWDWRFLLLIVASGVLDFAAGWEVARAPTGPPGLSGALHRRERGIARGLQGLASPATSRPGSG
jgi:hypothetical protein